MLHQVLIGGEWKDTGRSSGTFKAINPATGEFLLGEFPISPWPDIVEALGAGVQAAEEMAGLGPERLADYLEGFAETVEGRRADLVTMASLETALPAEPRLNSVEFPRMVDQIRQAAAACRERSWCRATIDTKLNIRSKFGPLGGPVVVFSPNNFPFAFNSVGGGDFVAALAAGNPVIAKANPGHPGTSKILAEAATEALIQSPLPPAAIQLLYHFQPEDGLRLVSHASVGATAFTGSRRAGLKLKEAADRAGKPIYLEMSSSNPVFILPGALEERASAIAGELFTSCTLGAGQFCTKPGLVALIDNEKGREFLAAVKASFAQAEPGILLDSRVIEGLQAAVLKLKECGAELVAGGGRAGGAGFRFAVTLLRVSGAVFLKNPGAFQVEAFGSLSVVVTAHDLAELKAVAACLDGQLTATAYSSAGSADDAAYAAIEPILRQKAGRLLNDKMPTGVAVSPAMNHGGPFPATGHPGFTSVGIPSAITRFAALHCYDNVRAGRLPAELRDKNPTGRMWRFIDGEWTRQDCR